MQTEIIHISKKVRFENSVRSTITFRPFVEFLQNSLHAGLKIKDPYFKWILKKFKKSPELLNSVPIDKLYQYKEILELVSTCLLPLAADEKSLWALSEPLAPEIFYSTDGFHAVMNRLKHPAPLNPSEIDADGESDKIINELQYGLILEKVYELPFLKKTDWIRKFQDPESGLDKYYEINIDTRFIDVRPLNELPPLDCTTLLPSSVWGEEFKRIQQLVPLNKFEASGFSVITLTDVTAQQAVEEIGKLIFNRTSTDQRTLFEEITHSLQTIAGSRYFNFGIAPFLSINDRPALMFGDFPYSIILQSCWKFEVPVKVFAKFRTEYANNPYTAVWSAGSQKSDFPDEISEAFKKAGISTYIMFPVYHNQKIAGIFEVSTRDNYPILSEGQLVKLKPALPLMTQLIQNIHEYFNSNIESVIKEQFTGIQPAVQWKFNEAAWHYLRDRFVEDRKTPIEDISFPELHPLYGAVDIKNSTVLRNQVLEKDYNIQLKILIESFSELNLPENAGRDQILLKAKNWLEILLSPLSTQQEIRLNEFFTLEVQYEIDNILKSSPGADKILSNYMQAADEQDGIAFENRRQLETGIRELNGLVNHFFEEASLELQQIYPCYFDKFRTDGVENDIYVGQSIAPKKPFQKEVLQQMKRWQLDTMIRVVHLTENLEYKMYALQTTQLLFIHPQTIDITFRKDERRFDVEGAYNIRYHIIKKRIDKVLIQDTQERLTQPGKIALVYFDDRDARSYLEIIQKLQEQNLLLNDMEELELESLQGVNGLKAIRVGVRI